MIKVISNYCFSDSYALKRRNSWYKHKVTIHNNIKDFPWSIYIDTLCQAWTNELMCMYICHASTHACMSVFTFVYVQMRVYACVNECRCGLNSIFTTAHAWCACILHAHVHEYAWMDACMQQCIQDCVGISVQARGCMHRCMCARVHAQVAGNEYACTGVQSRVWVNKSLFAAVVSRYYYKVWTLKISSSKLLWKSPSNWNISMGEQWYKVVNNRLELLVSLLLINSVIWSQIKVYNI